jgi:succinyl-diaminopimelate desuccinylase
MAPELTPLALTQKLLSFNTMQPQGSEKECALYLAGILEGAGFKIGITEFEPGRTTVTADLDGTGDKPPICLTGHIDTVPLGTLPWKYDPFKGEVDGDKLYGRGATDMKAGIAATVIAALKVAEEPGRKAGIKLIYTAGEEQGCKGTLHLAGKPEILKKAGALVVAEPTKNHPVSCHRGALWLQVSATGTTAHGALPHLGDNAIYKIVEMIGKIKDFNFKVLGHDLLGPATLNVGTIGGGQNINSVPDMAGFTIDCRTLPGMHHHALLGKLKETMGGEAEIRILSDLQAVETNPHHPWIETVRTIAKGILKTDLPPEGKLAFTDAGALTPAFGHCPTVILGPGDQNMCHKTDEYCLVSKIEEAVEIYIEVIRNWCFG